MNGPEIWHIANEIAEGKHPFTGNPYSLKEVEAHEVVVSQERKRLLDDRHVNGDASELGQEIKRQMSNVAH